MSTAPDEPREEEFFTADQIMEVNAAIFGKVNALELIVGTLLEDRADLDAIERRLDELLLDREAHFVAMADNPEFTLRVHEATRKNIAAALISARHRYGRPKT